MKKLIHSIYGDAFEQHDWGTIIAISILLFVVTGPAVLLPVVWILNAICP